MANPKTQANPKPQAAALRACACTSVRRTGRVLARTFDAALAESGINITQLAVMRALLRHPDEPLSRVAEDLAMDRTSLYRALAALKQRRWITLHEGVDGRSRSASLRPEGQAALARAEPGWERTQRAIIERFGASQWQALVADLRRLAQCAQQCSGATTAGPATCGVASVRDGAG